MTKGQVVTVKLYGGETAKRRVVAVKENVVVICAEDEYQAAQRQGREPEGLGFPWSDVLEPVEANPGITEKHPYAVDARKIDVHEEHGNSLQSKALRKDCKQRYWNRKRK